MHHTCITCRRAGVLFLAGFTLSAILGSSASAVIIPNGLGNSTTNTTAPGDDFGFANVGKGSTQQSSVTYLGNQWAITAQHVTINGSGVFFGGNQYFIDNSIQLLNQDSSPADLKLIHLTSDPGLPAVQIATQAPVPVDVPNSIPGSTVTMLGNGKVSDALGQVYLKPNGPNIDAYTSPPSGSYYSGYLFEHPFNNVLRYGENIPVAIDGPSNVTFDGFLNVHAYITTFDNGNYPGPAYTHTVGTSFPNGAVFADEAAASPGDSGGGVFEKIAGQWYLSGIMVGASFENGNVFVVGDNTNTARSSVAFSDFTIIADLSLYRDQIVAVVPEPNGLVLGLIGAVGMAVMAWISRRRAWAKLTPAPASKTNDRGNPQA